jgi:hypothetical protein
MHEADTTMVYDQRQYGAFAAFNDSALLLGIGNWLAAARKGEDVCFHNSIKTIRGLSYRRE